MAPIELCRICRISVDLLGLLALLAYLKTQLFNIAYSEREHSARSLPLLCASDSLAIWRYINLS